MTIYLAVGLLLIAALYLGLNKREKGDHAPKRQVDEPKLTKPLINSEVAAAKPFPDRPDRSHTLATVKEVPKVLLDLRLAQLSDLPTPQVNALLTRLQVIPRPPHALDKLVDAEFLATASSAVLNELMAGEPQITAKVLASVNSPMYGLQRPLGSIGQAVTYLGMNTVRGICMQYMLNASFKATTPELKIFYETIFEASAYSSELCFKLAQLLQLPDPGNLVTQVVLSYLGPLTTCSLLDKAVVISLAQSGPIERAQVEQEKLGLCAAEIGSLLMQTWKVPDGLIQDVRDIDKVLGTPCGTQVDTRSARIAFCYLCNRIGVMIASGELVDLRSLDISNSESIEHFFLIGYLKHPSLARLTEFLHLPEVLTCVDQMTTASQFKNQRTSRP